RVDLPEPEGPTSTHTSPERTVSAQSLSTWRSPKVLCRPSISITASAAAGTGAEAVPSVVGAGAEAVPSVVGAGGEPVPPAVGAGAEALPWFVGAGAEPVPPAVGASGWCGTGFWLITAPPPGAGRAGWCGRG